MKISALIKTLAICLITWALAGQAIVTSGNRPQSLSSFLIRLERYPPASLVLFDTSDEVWEQDFERIRREDPYVMLNLYFIPLDIDQGAGNELREREGWPAQTPHWAIFSADGRIIADGAALPTSTQLADECSRANITGNVDIYRRFLREYPYNEEARNALLYEMLMIAALRTRSALQVPEYPWPKEGITFLPAGVRDSRGDPSAEQIESLPELTPEADERIWKDYCVELQRYLEWALWQSRGSGSYPILSAWARFSPITRAAYSRAALTVEAALARQPSSSVLWGLWETLQMAGAGSPMKELLATLQPSPNIAPADWPPASVRASYLKLCREAGDWKAIQELVEPAWNSLASITQARSTQAVTGGNTSSFFSQNFWGSSGEAYLEALLMQQRLSVAEDMMKTWASGSGWPGAFSSAAAIAERLGHESIGKSWRALGEK